MRGAQQHQMNCHKYILITKTKTFLEELDTIQNDAVFQVYCGEG